MGQPVGTDAVITRHRPSAGLPRGPPARAAPILVTSQWLSRSTGLLLHGLLHSFSLELIPHTLHFLLL